MNVSADSRVQAFVIHEVSGLKFVNNLPLQWRQAHTILHVLKLKKKYECMSILIS